MVCGEVVPSVGVRIACDGGFYVEVCAEVTLSCGVCSDASIWGCSVCGEVILSVGACTVCAGMLLSLWCLVRVPKQHGKENYF